MSSSWLDDHHFDRIIEIVVTTIYTQGLFRWYKNCETASNNNLD